MPLERLANHDMYFQRSRTLLASQAEFHCPQNSLSVGFSSPIVSMVSISSKVRLSEHENNKLKTITLRIRIMYRIVVILIRYYEYKDIKNNSNGKKLSKICFLAFLD